MTKLFVLLKNKGLIKVKFEDEEYVYTKKFEDFNYGLKIFKYDKLKEYETTISLRDE